MTDTSLGVEDPLRVSDLVPLRRMLGAHSMVIRVNPDGTLVPFEIMPSLFYGRPIRQLLSDEVKQQFAEACEVAIARLTRLAFRPDGFGENDEVMITPILANEGDQCRFLVCWARRAETERPTLVGEPGLEWEDLRLEDVVVRYRVFGERGANVVEASPWWALPGRAAIELWRHHARVSAMGLATETMTSLIFDTFDEIGGLEDDSKAVRILVPSAELLSGLVPTFHGALRASRLSPERVIVAIPVELAVDPDLLPVIVHLRTMGMQIDIVGLDALTATLQRVSDTSDHPPALYSCQEFDARKWARSIGDAVSDFAVGN